MYQNRQRQLACWVLQLRHSKRCWQFDSRVVLEGVWDANHRLQVPDWAPFLEAWVVVLTLAGTTCSLQVEIATELNHVPSGWTSVCVLAEKYQEWDGLLMDPTKPKS